MKKTEWEKTATILQPWGDLGREHLYVRYPKKYAGIMKRTGFDTIILIPPAGHNDISRNKYNDGEFKRALGVYKQAGIRIMIYACHVHIGHDPVWHEFVKEKPEWCLANEDGDRCRLFGDYLLCPNHPEVFDYSLNYTVGLVRDYEPDCIMIDNNFFRGANGKPGCYCPGCRRKFREHVLAKFTPAETKRKFGISSGRIPIPKQKNRGPLYEEWIDWRYEMVRQWTRRTTDALKAAKSDLVVTTNSLYGIAGWGGAIETQFEEQDVVFAETYGPPLRIGIKSRHARAIGGNRPVWHYIKTWKSRTNDGKDQLLDPENVAALLGACIGSGACPWIVAFAWYMDRKSATGDVIAGYVKFFARWREYFKDIDYLSDVALVASRYSIDHRPEYRIETGKWYPDVFNGNQELFVHAHLPFHIIEDRMLEGKLPDYKLLWMPAPACVSDRQVASMERFVKNGGFVVITENTGEYDELGNKRKTPALQSLISGKPEKDTSVSSGIHMKRHGKGGVVFLRGDCGKAYGGNGRTEYVSMLKDIVGLTIGKTFLDVRNCPLSVEVNPGIKTVAGKREYLLHIMNHGEGGILKNIRIGLRIKGGKRPTKAFRISPEFKGRRPVTLKHVTGGVELIVPETGIYSLVVVE